MGQVGYLIRLEKIKTNKEQNKTKKNEKEKEKKNISQAINQLSPFLDF